MVRPAQDLETFYNSIIASVADIKRQYGDRHIPYYYRIIFESREGKNAYRSIKAEQSTTFDQFYDFIAKIETGVSWNERMGSDVKELDGTIIDFQNFDIFTTSQIKDSAQAFTHPLFTFCRQSLGSNCVESVKQQLRLMYQLETTRINKNQTIEDLIVKFRDYGCIVLLKSQPITLHKAW